MIPLNDLEVYKISLEIGDIIWDIVGGWQHFEKDTLGKQIVRSADSMALNISEGYGRFHFAENKNFCYYSRGSAFETSTALIKARKRKLLSEEKYNLIHDKLLLYFKLINAYIKSIGKIKNNEQRTMKINDY
jgi:four helix bundle protein